MENHLVLGGSRVMISEILDVHLPFSDTADCCSINIMLRNGTKFGSVYKTYEQRDKMFKFIRQRLGDEYAMNPLNAEQIQEIKKIREYEIAEEKKNLHSRFLLAYYPRDSVEKPSYHKPSRTLSYNNDGTIFATILNESLLITILRGNDSEIEICLAHCYEMLMTPRKTGNYICVSIRFGQGGCLSEKANLCFKIIEEECQTKRIVFDVEVTKDENVEQKPDVLSCFVERWSW
jgi:hypothetical protein